MHQNHVSSRRKWLQGAGVALAGLSTMNTVGADENDKSMLIIDCHAHIYGEDEKKYPTIDEPYRPPPADGSEAR